MYNVSQLQDSLLSYYDNSWYQIWEVNMQVCSMGPISEMDMVSKDQLENLWQFCNLQSYWMDSYFQQSWVDKRLSFSGYQVQLVQYHLVMSCHLLQSALALSIEMLRKIWKPDTFVYNGKRSYLHTITTPNRFVR